MGRRTLIAVLGAAVVGSTGGGLAALQLTPRTARRPHKLASVAAPPAPAASPVPAPADAAVAAVAAAAAPDPRDVLATQLTAVLTRFTTWSRDHAGAPCPDLATLGLVARDPWGHDLALTCTDQPADQRIGAVSAGPDRVFGTDDDIPSWTFGHSVTSLVRGRRWQPAATAAERVTRPSRPHKEVRAAAASRPAEPPAPAAVPSPQPATIPAPASATPPPRPAPSPPDATGDDIPTRRSSR